MSQWLRRMESDSDLRPCRSLAPAPCEVLSSWLEDCPATRRRSMEATLNPKAARRSAASRTVYVPPVSINKIGLDDLLSEIRRQVPAGKQLGLLPRPTTIATSPRGWARKGGLRIGNMRSRSYPGRSFAGRGQTFADIADREGKAERHIRHLARLAFVSPRIITAIIDGTAPAGITATALMAGLSARWPRPIRQICASG
jgi:hypothetical protein